MIKTIIAGAAALILSAGAAVAQSNSDQNSMSSGTPASATASSDTAPKKVRSVAAHYPKAEAKLNREEAQQTKQLNLQESQEVASNSGPSSQPQ